jgi:hypothetical protein
MGHIKIGFILWANIRRTLILAAMRQGRSMNVAHLARRSGTKRGHHVIAGQGWCAIKLRADPKLGSFVTGQTPASSTLILVCDAGEPKRGHDRIIKSADARRIARANC